MFYCFPTCGQRISAGRFSSAVLFSGEAKKSPTVTPDLRSRLALAIAAAILLAGCATPEPQTAAPEPEVAEVELNLPEPVDETSCDCDAVVEVQENYFDRGVRALAARDYEQAGIYFERHRDSEGSEAQREADVGIAFVTLMSEASIATSESGSSGVDERAEVMILALAAVQTLEGRIEALDALNKAISEDLEKREEALKRLRDLTLGQ